MPGRGRLAVAMGAATFALLMAMSAVVSPTSALPPAVGGALLAALVTARTWPREHAWLTVVPGAVSLGATALTLVADPDLTTADGLYGLVEVAILCVLLAGIVRWSARPLLWPAATVTAVAQVAWIVRFLPDRGVGPVLAGCALWSIPSVMAAVVGGYPRLAAARLRYSVAHARAEQRRALERDVHDYVAHDISGMIVQAQAARFAAADDPAQLREALRRIEQTGQQAMSSMDRALELLGDGAGPPSTARHPGLDDLERLVSDFHAAGTVSATVSISGPADDLPREVDQTLYRVCVEALTNVRRHAPTATTVSVALSVDAEQAVLVVHDDGASVKTGRGSLPRGGSGLRAIRGRVEALGGSLTAEGGRGGWRVRAVLPLRTRS